MNLFISDWKLCEGIDGRELLDKIVNKERLIPRGILITGYVDSGMLLLKTDSVITMPKLDFMTGLGTIIDKYSQFV